MNIPQIKSIIAFKQINLLHRFFRNSEKRANKQIRKVFVINVFVAMKSRKTFIQIFSSKISSIFKFETEDISLGKETVICI